MKYALHKDMLLDPVAIKLTDRDSDLKKLPAEITMIFFIADSVRSLG